MWCFKVITPWKILSQDVHSVYLCSPDVVQILHGKSFLLDDEAKDLLQFLDILWLVQTVPQYNGQDVVLLDPLLK